MRGASALQHVLDEYSGEPLVVLVVWEPVLATDIAPPITATLGIIHDSRASQYWDDDRTLSADIVASLMASPERYGVEQHEFTSDTVIWDAVAVFPAGALWEHDFPAPVFLDYPVVRATDGLRGTLTAQLDREGVRPLSEEGTR